MNALNGAVAIPDPRSRLAVRYPHPCVAARSRRASRPLSGAVLAPVPPCFAPSLAWHPCRSCSLRSLFPPRRAGGLFALVPVPGRRRKAARAVLPALGGRAHPAPASALRRRPSPCPVRSPPPALPPGGWGCGLSCSSCCAAPAAPSAAPAAGGWWLSSFAVGLCGGVLCLFSRFLLRPLLCGRPALRSRLGLGVRWVFRSARPPALCPASWPWCGFRPPWLLAGLLRLGGVACRPCVAVAWCARFRAGLRFPSRLRRLVRLGVVGRPVRWRCGSPRLVLWALSRALFVPAPVRRVRRARRGGLFGWSPPAGGVPPAGVGRGGRCVGCWPFRRCRVRGGCGFLCPCRRAGRGGVCGCVLRCWPLRVCAAFRRAGRQRRRWWPRFWPGGVSLRALPCWFVAVAAFVGLLLRVGFRLLGVRCVRCQAGVARGGVSVRVFGAAALGRVAASVGRVVGRVFVGLSR